jgi:xanthine dehydrogenase accessory factor
VNRLSTAEAVALAAEALTRGPAAVGATVVQSAGRPAVGERLMIWSDRHLGWLDDRALEQAVIAAAREVLGGGRPGVVEIAPGCSVYLEVHRPPPSLVIVGAGHIARPLCRVGAMLGFRVVVLDDRPEFATRERFPEADAVLRADFGDPFRGVPVDGQTHLVLVTRGHKYDFEALRDLLARDQIPAYIGMVGSRRRVRAALEQLSREGLPAERLRAVHAPIGLDLGAETPEEIAIAIAAELVLLRRGGTGAALRDRERVMERWIGKGRDQG